MGAATGTPPRGSASTSSNCSARSCSSIARRSPASDRSRNAYTPVRWPLSHVHFVSPLTLRSGFWAVTCHPPAFTQPAATRNARTRSEEHTSELQSRGHLVCRLLLENTKESKETQYRRT